MKTNDQHAETDEAWDISAVGLKEPRQSCQLAGKY